MTSDLKVAEIKEEVSVNESVMPRENISTQLHSISDRAVDLFLQSAPQRCCNHKDIMAYQLQEKSYISCVNWRGRCFITGTGR